MITIDFTNKDIVSDNQSLYQWDYGQKLEIIGTCITQDTQIHFARENQQAERRIGTYADNVLVVDIPDILLQSAGKFKAYVYVTDEVSGQTIKVANFNVRAREKPNDYTSENYVDIVAQLSKKLDTIIETGIAHYEPDPTIVENLVNQRLELLGALSEKDEVDKSDLTSALATEIDGKLSSDKIVKSLAVTEEGFIPDAKTVSTAFSDINNNLVALTLAIVNCTNQTELNNALNDTAYGNNVWYRKLVNVTGAGLTLEGGVWYLEGFKASSSYGWQKASKYSASGLVVKSRVDLSGVWQAWV